MKNNTIELRYIKPRIKERGIVYNSCRQSEVKLSRLSIGLTRLTYGHHMSRNDQEPTCRNQILTIRHCILHQRDIEIVGEG